MGRRALQDLPLVRGFVVQARSAALCEIGSLVEQPIATQQLATSVRSRMGRSALQDLPLVSGFVVQARSAALCEIGKGKLHKSRDLEDV